jgi:hypothetical protein
LTNCPSDLLDRTRHLAVFRHSLTAFAQKLQDHFAFEEDGGYMSDVVAHRPELAGKIAELHRQHRQLAVMLEELVSSLERDASHGAETRNGRAPLPAEFIDGLLKLLDALEAHERAESSLFRGYLLEDHGGP